MSRKHSRKEQAVQKGREVLMFAELESSLRQLYPALTNQDARVLVISMLELLARGKVQIAATRSVKIKPQNDKWHEDMLNIRRVHFGNGNVTADTVAADVLALSQCLSDVMDNTLGAPEVWPELDTKLGTFFDEAIPYFENLEEKAGDCGVQLFDVLQEVI